MGFPLSSMPLPGACDPGTISPGDSTKRTVKQLYSALTTLSGNDSMASAGDV
jgi:hypothetical protein